MSNFLGVVTPPGQYPPFATITPTDHAAWIIIAAALGLSISLLFAGIRVFIRSMISAEYGLDDALLAVATVLAVVQSAVVLIACADGLGKSIKIIPADMHGKVQQMNYASNLLFVIVLGLSKAAVAYFLLRLTPVQAHRRFIRVLLGLIAAWTVVLFFAVALQCDLWHPWLLVGQKCTGQALRWQVLEAIGSLFELALFTIAIWLVWGLRTTRGNKTVVIVAFGFRLLMIVIIALRLGSFDQAGSAIDPTLLEAQFIAWTQTEMNYSLVSATIPILRPLVNNLATHYGGGHGHSGDAHKNGWTGSYVRSSASISGTYQMNTLKSATQIKNQGEELLTLESNSHGVYTYGVASGRQGPSKRHDPNNPKGNNADATSVGSNDSQRMIIRKDITWQVQHDAEKL